MRLINATTLQLEDFPSAYHVPAYAVLSHTWEDDEVLFHEMVTAPSAAKRRKGYGKILKAAQLARARGLSHVWVDTCCIDKSSSAELTEAINSMYRWYECAGACIAYLSDLAPGNDLDLPEGLDKCRWFTRGWTLQELIAPRHVDFYDAAWSFRGSKANLSDCITRITGIEKDVLDHTTPLANLSVAKRMSWAAKRQTTRIEDIAYCLLGIFDVNMPMLYGEGEKAFIRLQEKIIQSSCDLSIFAWTYHPPDNTRARLSPGPAYRSLYKWPSPFRAIQGLLDVSKLQETVSSCEAHLVDSPTEIPNYKPAPRQYHGEYHGILADLPWHFQNCGDIRLVRGTESIPGHFSLTNRGLRIGWPLDLSPVSSTSFAYRYVMSLGCSNGSSPTLGVFLRKCGSDLYVRMNPEKLAFLPYEEPDNEICQARDFYIMASVPKHRCFIANHAHEDTTDVSRGQSNNIVLRNRAVGLQVLAPGGTSDNWLALPHPGGLRKLEAYPPGLWDEHDMAFFEASELPRSWCVYYFDGDVRIKEGIAQLKYIFALVGWAARGDGAVSPQYTLVSPDEVSPTRLAVFLSSLTTASPESSSWFLETFTRMFGRPMAPRSVPATIITDDVEYLSEQYLAGALRDQYGFFYVGGHKDL
ncbi:hypothetical protein OQA88_2566 [Cercophora sp. LCS_1]